MVGVWRDSDLRYSGSGGDGSIDGRMGKSGHGSWMDSSQNRYRRNRIVFII
jgi:hypothetical protein